MVSRTRTGTLAQVVVLLLSMFVLSVGVLAEESTSPDAAEPLSLGKSYTFDVRPPLRNYPDPEGTKLTDGVLAPSLSYTDPHWVGFWSTEPFALTIDLGEVTAIRQVRTHHLAGVAGIVWPTNIYVQFSSDRIRWTTPLEIVPPEPIFPDEVTSRWFTFDDLEVEARFVQLVYFPPTEGKNVFIDEIEVY